MKSAGAEDGALFTNSYCNICNAQLISESQRVAHYESKKHANKVRLYYMLHPEDGGPPSKKLRPDDPESDETEVDKNKCCTLCNMFFTSAIVAESHYQGKIHAKRVKLVLGESLSAPTPPEPTQEPPEPQEMNTDDCATTWVSMNGGDSGKFCNLCRAWFNNPLMAQQHYEGKKHKKNAARARLLQRLGETLDSEALEALRSSYSCNRCHVVLNSIEQYHAHLQGARHQSNVNGGNPDEPKNGAHVLQLSSDVLVNDGGSCGTSPAKYSKRKRWATFSSDDTSGSSSPTAPETQLVLEGAAYFQDGLQTTLFSGVLMKRSRIIY